MFWDSVKTSGDPSQLSLASLWLPRAGLRPRSLWITRYGPAAPIQSLIAQFPFSWIKLGIRDDAEKLDFSEIPIESLLPLKILRLGNSESDSSQLSLGHHSFPNLSTLYMCRYFDSLSALVTSKTIENLWIDAPVPISICLKILRSATNLREIMHLVVDDTETVASIQDVVAPNLTDVKRLYFEYGYSAGPLISALTAPNLKFLRVAKRMLKIRLAFDASSFLPKAGQSRMPKLETLFIDETTRPVDIGILLRSIPSLRILILESKTILNENTMQGLASGELGPRLWKMHLQDECIAHDPERILTMIEARRGLDIGMGNDSWGRSSSKRMIFSFVVRDGGKLDEYERRISDLGRDGVIVQFNSVRINFLYWRDFISQ